MDETPLPPPEVTPDKSLDKTAKFRALFFEESAELLQDAERCLQQSAAGASDEETAGTLFRSVHSIKSGAASFGMRRLVTFAHTFETTLEELRRGSYALDNIRRHLFLRGYDMMASLLHAEATQLPLPEAAEFDLLKAFEGLTGLATALRADPNAPQANPQAVTLPMAGANSAIRIELAKIDRLVNLASELTILESMLRQRVENGSDSDSLLQGLDQLALKVRDLHDATMGARAQPLDNVFQRLPRLVRELADSLGKRVELVTAGGEVEVDKTIIEQLIEPLTHILRNAIDHGIETVPVRQQLGKPMAGTIRIEARCIENRLQLTIADDGAGLNLPALREKAAARALDIDDEAALADLIFLPGLSTAAAVSEVSGRGVGLDAVRYNLAALGGTIEVSSAAGQGTCFSLSLPLTLAVMDGMIVTINGELYVLPLADLQEALSVSGAAIITWAGLPPLLRHADRYIPLVDTGLLLGCCPAKLAANDSEEKLVIVVCAGMANAGLPIDQIVGQQQVVIRAVHLNNATPRLSATILGDGRVALILTATQILAALQQSRMAA